MRVRKWKGVDSCNLREILDTHPYFYLEQITLQMELMSGRRWSRATVSREIRRLGVSLQVVYERARQIDGAQRAAYKIALHHHVSYVDQLVFIDETSKGENASVRRRFWNPIGGTQPFFEEFFGSHNKRYTMLAAGDVNGFIVESVDVVHRERGPRDTCPLRGTIGMERFEMWVEEKLCPVLGNWANAEPRSIVVIDNATIHHSERVRGMIMATGAKIIYTAPYSPDLNPIEYYFGVYKSYLKKFHTLTWLDAHLGALGAMTPTKASHFFAHCGVPGVYDEVVDSGVLYGASEAEILVALDTAFKVFFTYPVLALVEYLKTN